MDNKIECPHCNARLKMPVNLQGKKPRCPRCKKYVVADNQNTKPQETFNLKCDDNEASETIKQDGTVNHKKPNDIDNLVVSVILGFFSLFIVSIIQFNLVFTLISIGFIWYNAFGPLFTIQKLNREFLLKTYLKQEGPFYEFLKNRMLLTVAIPSFSSLITSFLAYIELLCMSFFDFVAIAVCYGLGRWLVLTASKPIKTNLNSNLVELVSLRITLLVSVILMVSCLAGLALVHGIQKDYSEVTADEMATEIISNHKHPVKIIKDVIRTIKYSEFQLLRIRDSIGGKYGWAIYLLFLIPHALPAVGFACFFLNIEINYKEENSVQKTV